MHETDVFISGGGMVGLTLALALARGGLRVTMADPMPVAAVLDAGFDGRVSALSYSSVRMFEALGIWEHLAPQAQPIHDILVSDAGLDRAPSPLTLHFDHREIGQPMGYIVENRHIRQALHTVLTQVEGITLAAPAVARTFEVTDERVSADLGSHGEITAALMVAAEGRDSPSREKMGIGVIGWSYPQWGIVATVAHEGPPDGPAH